MSKSPLQTRKGIMSSNGFTTNSSVAGPILSRIARHGETLII